MHALIVVSHPLLDSLTHSVATAIAQGIAESDPQNSSELADLTQEGFNPTFTAEDMAAFHLTGATPAEVVAEQSRIDKADALVLVFPVYWWSMPGLLKGWIDRVFSNGWAYEETADGNVVKKLGRLRVHLVALGAASQKTYDTHGFTDAYNAQIVHGIFDYCGATVVSSEMLLLPDLGTAEAHLEMGHRLGQGVFSRGNRT